MSHNILPHFHQLCFWAYTAEETFSEVSRGMQREAIAFSASKAFHG